MADLPEEGIAEVVNLELFEPVVGVPRDCMGASVSVSTIQLSVWWGGRTLRDAASKAALSQAARAHRNRQRGHQTPQGQHVPRDVEHNVLQLVHERMYHHRGG